MSLIRVGLDRDAVIRALKAQLGLTGEEDAAAWQAASERLGESEG